MRRIAAIIISICIAVTGTCTGIPELMVTGDGIEASAASYPALKKINYKATGDQQKDIIGFAKTQVGYREGSNNNTYFGHWFGANYNPWCAMFVCWSARKAGVDKSIIPSLATADRGWAKKQGVYHKSKYWGGDYKPKKGDLIYFSWSVRDWADHIGMVTGTGKEDGTTYVYTVEGNKHDKVTEGTYALNNRYILGYASPKYTTGTPTTTTKPTTYKLKYRDGLDSTSNDEEDKIIPPVKGSFGKELTLSETKFKRSGYAYTEWDIYRENSNGKLIYLCRDDATETKEKWYLKSEMPDSYTMVTVECGGTLTINKAVTGTVYASPVWKKADYTITYKANGGIGAPAAQTKKENKDVKLSTNVPTREGYEFLGWAKKADATKAKFQPGDTYTDNKNLKLYAVWKLIPYAVVTIEGVNTRSGPGTTYEKLDTLDEGTQITITAVSEDGKWGMIEDGSWIDLEYTSKEDEVPVYTLEYSDGVTSTQNDRDVIKPVIVKFGKEQAIATDKFTRKGHHYSKYEIYRVENGTVRYYCRDMATGKKEKWYDEGQLSRTTKYEKFTPAPGENLKILKAAGDLMIITPIWELDTYTISYHAKGGKDAPNKQTKKYNKKLILSKHKPKKSGYDFRGWATSKTAKKVKYKPGAKFVKNKDTKLYAVWEKKATKVKTTSDVNKRKGPGTEYDVIGSISKGKVVSIVKKKNGWGKLKNGGWISLSLTKKVTSGTKSSKKTKATKSKKEPAKSSDSSLVFTVKVSSSEGVNVRTGPGRKYDVVTSYEKGKTLKIEKVKNGWGQLQNKSKRWILLKYTKITSGYRVKITSDDLNQRKGPGVQYDIKSVIKPGKYNISKINGDWGKVKETGYWVYLAYTTRIK